MTLKDIRKQINKFNKDISDFPDFRALSISEMILRNRTIQKLHEIYFNLSEIESDVEAFNKVSSDAPSELVDILTSSQQDELQYPMYLKTGGTNRA